MEQPSVSYSGIQSVNYLGQTHKWVDTSVFSTQEKLREEHEQKRQEKFISRIRKRRTLRTIKTYSRSNISDNYRDKTQTIHPEANFYGSEDSSFINNII
ncbi:hypothetical protein RclHR1_04040004 [Rhizophagus clarus]|uniref:Uncharacterized protein n=1 Tax=Rhizophagus clarus TaxID=94130 RepID=A0A2Z6RG45_9GLOM|nr:hypothetical protein RclHR1_04040004 [Rhizophagus clarus]GES88036.1 hypothetical protein GLOIN_2v1790028 [Rhizophagus clarus]